MEKKFIHELFLTSKDPFWCTARVMAKFHIESKKNGKNGVESWFIEEAAKLENVSDVNGFVTRLVPQILADRGFSAMTTILYFLLKGETPNLFVFSKEFFDALKKANINSIPWSMLPDKFYGIIRLPYPLLDEDNDEFQEIFVMIKRRDEVEVIKGDTFSDSGGSDRMLVLRFRDYKAK